MQTFYDTHAHLDYPDFASDFEQVLERAQAAGISRMICIGTNEASSRRAIGLADKYPQIYAAVGWHPCSALEAPNDLRPLLRELGAHPKVVALGETGLDHFRLPSSQGGSSQDDENYKVRQAELFRQHLEVAAELKLNCVIHTRNSFAAALSELSFFSDRVKGVFHCFAEDTEAMRAVMEAGSFVSFTGIVTFKNAQKVRETLAQVPAGRFMLETDCPFLAPAPYRGKRCEPAYVCEIAQATAETRGCTLDELSKQTCDAARTFFPKLNA